MRVSGGDLRNQYRMIYDLFCQESARIHAKDIASKLGIDPRTAGRRIREASSRGYVVGPQIRKRSYSNMKEYVYFVNVGNPLRTYSEVAKNPDIEFYAGIIGCADFMAISRKKIDLGGDVVIEGVRSDYYIPQVPRHTWERALRKMREKTGSFDSNLFEPRRLIKTRSREDVTWDEEDENLFRYFEFDVRKPFTPVMKQHLISTGKIYKFLQRVDECCTRYTGYFPDGVSAYDPYFFVFETKYEDFVIDLFSELPTCSWFFKVGETLLVLAHLVREYFRINRACMSDIARLPLLSLTRSLLESGIVKSEKHALVEYWGIK
ncbi:MAG: winged helix-turn-helix domain-containing protein [Theionarchaea archaeon]|nr:winged helix-turn-helix domain-containing protein [Theionarchaea archaeon]MBU7020400.1 winged helix-turn-helix domain-containing protein [Theionarchaea archaeon]